MPLKTLNDLSGVYHDQGAFMQALAAAVSDPKHLFFQLEGAATLQKSILLGTPIYVAGITLSNGAVAMATATNTTAIDVSQFDNVTPTKVGNSIAAKAANVALGANLSAVLALSATLADRLIAAGNQITVGKTIAGTQGLCCVDVLYWDVATGFVPA